jgi:bile acid:Na+ symporter, BASS family
MLAMGMSQRLAEVVAPLQRPLTVVLALAVNFILAPLFALVLSRIIPLQPGHAVGLLLLGAAAGAPFLPKLAELCGGNLAYAVTLMVLLMGGSTLFMPFVLPLLVPGLTAEPWIIAKPLVLYMMIPLGTGFALALSRLSWVERVLPFVRALSNLALVLLVVLLVGLNLTTVLSTFGSFAVACYTLYLLALIAAAWVLGAAERPTRNVFALGAGCRNIPAAFVVARESFDDPATQVMLVVAFDVSLVVLLPLARAMRPTAGL